MTEGTAFARAFQAAGYEAPDDRLRAIARKALQDHPRSFDAVRDCVLHATRNDAALLWALFGRWQRPAIDLLISGVAAGMRAERMLKSGTTLSAETNPAPSPGSVGKQADAPTQPEREEARSAVVRVLSKLDTFVINRRPIGDCTPEEAYAWADAQSRNARFARALASNLPPGIPIRRSITPAEANEMYARIEREMTNE